MHAGLAGKPKRSARLQRRRGQMVLARATAALGLLLLAGCGNMGWWFGPHVARPLPVDVARRHVADLAPGGQSPLGSDGTEYLAFVADPRLDASRRLALSEFLYSAAMAAERNSSCRSVDLFYGAAVTSWQFLASGCQSADDIRGQKLYHSSLARMLDASGRFHRFDPVLGLAIELPGGWQRVPVSVHSRTWTREEVGTLLVVGNYYDPILTHRFRRKGVGVPVVSHRRAGNLHPFVPTGQPFALTALLRVRADVDSGSERTSPSTIAPGALSGAPIELEFYDPLIHATAQVAGELQPLASDITAPLVEGHRLANFQPVVHFLRADEDYQLSTFGPHERGKIPIIFVHGLLSDPLTYLEMANEIRGDSELGRRYEVWAFRYPTGGAVLEAAASLRDQVTAATASYAADDPALGQMVIVGHSMGGLVSKLQVTHSDTTLWTQFARRPFNELRADPRIRKRIARALFFDPSPSITRIVLIATPQEGSPWADRAIGRFASMCAKGAPQTEAAFRTVVDENPDVFLPSAPRRPPTSIDLLEPSNQVLYGIRMLRYSCNLTVHTIIGDTRNLAGAGPSDGVVPVASAEDPAAVSQFIVPAKHTAILRAPESIAEIKRILHRHLQQTTGGQQSPELIIAPRIVPVVPPAVDDGTGSEFPLLQSSD